MFIIKDNDNIVIGIYSSGGVPVETSATIPQKDDNLIGYDAILKYNPDSDAMYWNYMPRPLTSEEIALKTSHEISVLQEAIDALIIASLA